MRASALGVVATIVASVTTAVMAAEPPPECTSPAEGEPMFITESCEDPDLQHGYVFVDVDEVRQVPIPHRFVHGGFRGTDAKFAFYFPDEDQYQGRFFQGPVHHLRLTSELASQAELEFAFASGGYVVQTNNGGNDSCLAPPECKDWPVESSYRSYRVAAAAAKFSREVAADIYGPHRPYGYVFGGSGGADMTISALQNTSVWDGGVPYVLPHTMAYLGNLSPRLHGLRVLRQRDKFPCIMDAIDPGGSGDPYASCDLNEEEASAYREVSLQGFPPRGWHNHESLTGGTIIFTGPYVQIFDPEYVNDFWTEPGYLGHDDPYGTLADHRIQHPTTIVAATPPLPNPDYELLGPAYSAYMLGRFVVGLPPRVFALDSMPEGDLTAAELVIASGPNQGTKCTLQVVRDLPAAASFFSAARPVSGAAGTATAALPPNLVTCGGNSHPEAISKFDVGDEVMVDNSSYLALQTYYRHEVPSPDFYAWDQFRDPEGQYETPDGQKVIHPQRDLIVDRLISQMSAGSIHSGKFHGKMILIQNLMDIDAFPWGGDWYRNLAEQHPGSALDERFRLWFNDHAQHGAATDPARTVSYTGVVQQALRDLAAWVENDAVPPDNTSYSVQDTQVSVAPTAAERGGIQPVVDVTVNGGVRADVEVGETVELTATIAVPPGTGKIVGAEWNFVGTGGTYTAAPISPAEAVTVKATFSYSEPGTYFPVLRATSQRRGDPEAVYGRVQNLGRVRIVVG